jgi:hypothetical protein
VKVDCDVNFVLAAFLKSNSDWVPYREHGQFVPITGLKTHNGKLWISTYGSDYFPADISEASGIIQLENIVFRRPLPNGDADDPARLVERYKGKHVHFQVSMDTETCETMHGLKIRILNIADGPDEIIDFTRSDDP